jgi:hypothetical protein
VIHVMAVAGLGGSPVTATIVSDEPETVMKKEHQLAIPVVSAERPSVMKDEGLRVPGSPVFVEDLHTILGRDHTRHLGSF